MTESPESVLNNVQYFVEQVLKEANANKRWIPEELKRAWKWAQYCQMFSADLQKINKFDRFVQTISNMMPQYETKQLWTALRNPLVAFNKAMLQNPFLDNRTFRELLDLNHEAPFDVFQNDLVKLVVERNVAAQMLSMGTDHDFVSDFHLKLQMDFRIAHLREAFESKSKDAIKDFVESSFGCEFTLVMMINVVIELGKLQDCKCCFDCLITKLLDKCSTDPKSRVSIMTAENAKLAELCVQSLTFYKYYVDFLIEECEWLFRTEGNTKSWEQSPDHLPFESLIKHWSQLLKQKNIVGKTTSHLLRDLVSKSNHGVWSEIFMQQQLVQSLS